MYDDRSILIIKKIKIILYSLRKNIGCRFHNFNITGPQAMIIKTLDMNGKMKISDLSKSVGLSNSTVSGIVDRLQKQGLIERTKDKTDRRIVYVSVTLKLKEEIHENLKEVEEQFEKLVSKASPDEIDNILKGITSLQNLIERWK